MKRPPITEPDAGSYLDGSMDVHEVLFGNADTGLRLDGSLAWDGPAMDALRDADPLCRACSVKVLDAAGFDPVAVVPVAYQPTHPFRPEEVYLFRDEAGTVTHSASYAYGRAYFDPNEPRTAPCASCGTETLRDMPGVET